MTTSFFLLPAEIKTGHSWFSVQHNEKGEVGVTQGKIFRKSKITPVTAYYGSENLSKQHNGRTVFIYEKNFWKKEKISNKDERK